MAFLRKISIRTSTVRITKMSVVTGKPIRYMPIIEQLDELILARQRFAHGVQTLFFDHPNCIAFSPERHLTNIPAAWWSCRMGMMAKKPFIWRELRQ